MPGKSPISTMDDADFRKLLVFLGYSWQGYRRVRKGVKKRIRRHLLQLGCWDIDAYLELIRHRADCRHECELLMTVSISRFFRDRHLWQLLENRWLPDMIAGNCRSMAVWSAGCACGEEVYSFKIVWERLKSRFGSLPPLEILATDRHPQVIGRARSGIYNRSSLREVAADMRAEFFEIHRATKLFRIKAALKGDICWETGDVLAATPGRMFNVIFLRNNILTYLRPGDRAKALIPMVDRLTMGGLFITGCREDLPIETGELVPTDECSFVYRKR